MDNNSKYIRELKKWCRKQLKHIKKPRIRKRVMVERMAFVVIMHYMKGGISTRTKDFRPGGFTSHAKESGNGEFVILKPMIRAHRDNTVAPTSPDVTMIFMENNRSKKEVDDIARELRTLRDMMLKGKWITDTLEQT